MKEIVRISRRIFIADRRKYYVVPISQDAVNQGVISISQALSEHMTALGIDEIIFAHGKRLWFSDDLKHFTSVNESNVKLSNFIL